MNLCVLRYTAGVQQRSADQQLNEDYQKAHLRSEQSLKAAEARLAEMEQRSADLNEDSDNRLLREEVTEEDIARVVSLWTGVPVSRMMQGEREKVVADGKRNPQTHD